MSVTIEENISLLPYNTFKVQAKARFFTRIKTEHELIGLLQQPVFKENKRLILGGGSNCLFVNDFDGLVVKIETQGIEVVEQNADEIEVQVAAGEVWHNLVMHCVNKNWGGIENLALIPGTVGAAPIQNIGAYGVEVKNCIEAVRTIDIETGEVRVFNNDACVFSYRESIFKNIFFKKIFISSITLRLRTNNHFVNTSYSALNDYLTQQNITSPTIQDIARCVIDIRRSKLPDPVIVGNAGSFFKNPLVPITHLENLKHTFPKIPFYPFDNQHVKVPAGWLIETAGWKGKTLGNVGVHTNQALVLINKNNGTGAEVFQLSQHIMDDVFSKFGVTLTREVNIID